MEVAVEELFASKDKEWFLPGIQGIGWKMGVQTIEHEGLYFEY
jgi:hypothetical protein